MNMNILTLILAILFAGCQNTSPGQLELIGAQETKSDILLQINNESLVLDGKTISFPWENSLEISFPISKRVSLWQKREGKLSKLPAYSLSENESERKYWVALKEIQKPTNWFFSVSEGDFSAEEEVFLSTFTPSEKANSDNQNLIEPISWKIHTLVRDSNGVQANLIKEIEIIHSPVSLQLFIQKPGQNMENLRYLSGDIPEGSQLQMKLKAHQPTHLGIFLCYMEQERVQEIERIYPAMDIADTQFIAEKTSLIIPAQETVHLKTELGQAVIYCFPTEKTVSCSSLESWLSTKAKGYSAIVDLASEEVIFLGENKGVSQVEADYPHMRIDLAEVGQ